MKWQCGKTRDGEVFTALVNELGNTVGRYFHRQSGWVRDTVRNNARPHKVELLARAKLVASHSAEVALEIPDQETRASRTKNVLNRTDSEFRR